MLELENIIEEIKAKQQQKADLQQLFNDKVAQIKATLDAKIEQLDKDIYFLTQSARAEAEQLPMKETKTQKKVSLLSGDFVIKKATQKIEPNKAVLLEKVSSEYIEVKEVKSLKWAEYKKTLEIVDGQVIDTTTGEVVEGVAIEEVPEQIVIK